MVTYNYATSRMALGMFERCTRIKLHGTLTRWLPPINIPFSFILPSSGKLPCMERQDYKITLSQSISIIPLMPPKCQNLNSLLFVELPNNIQSVQSCGSSLQAYSVVLQSQKPTHILSGLTLGEPMNPFPSTHEQNRQLSFSISTPLFFRLSRSAGELCGIR
jgi:hypothetical protein